MDFIFELIFDLIFEGAKEGAKRKDISPWIRILCLILIILLGLAVIGGLVFLGIYLLVNPTDNMSYVVGVGCLIGDVVLIIGAIKEYKKYKKDDNKKEA